jgi:hypothetical protein
VDKLRSHLTFANVMATAAMFVALGGGAYAVTVPRNSIGTKQLKRNAVTGAKIKRSAVTSPKIKDRSLEAKDFKAGQLPAGAKGDKGDTGAQGADGPPGPFPDSLPSGKTVRGNYAAIGRKDATSGERAAGEISFGYTLSSAPITHYINTGASPPSTCPGSIASPQASPGHLCVYEGTGSFNILQRFICDPVGNACPAANRWGAYVEIIGNLNGTYYASGTWAVTAP